MTMPEEPVLTISLIGPNWKAELAVDPPTETAWKPVAFEVPGPPPRPIDARVRYTQATNQAPGWPDWHVKIYRCETTGDADDLRGYLLQQVRYVQRANARVRRRSGAPIDPPWAVVPVQIVRGDGVQENFDGIHTSLGTPAQQIISQLRENLPSWFLEDPPASDKYVLALSPYLTTPAWDTVRTFPRTEELADFRDLAAGLDTLHEHGIVHCDIRPANVCWYRNAQASGYVLIDTDAVTRTTPPPERLRTGALYVYRGIRRWQDELAQGRQLRVDPGVLLAQDRFAFAMVVLAALAGRHWVESTLLSPHDNVRAADSAGSVIEALTDHWQNTADRDWTPLIKVVAEPFSADLEQRGPWAADWIARLIAAEEECVQQPGPPPRTRIVSSGRTTRADDLDRILAEVHQHPAPKLRKVQHSYEVVQRRAEAVALRSAVGAALLFGGGLIMIALVLVVGALGMRK
jgi:hypothetical protein